MSKVNKIFLALFGLLLFLDYLALDDITTGREPSLLGEYAIIIVSVIIIGGIGFFYFRKRHSIDMYKKALNYFIKMTAQGKRIGIVAERRNR